jgi:phage baseplate assembly protein W
MTEAAKAPRPFLGQGLAFPLGVVGGRLALARGERKIEDAIRLILGTARGERLMRPDLGCGVHDLAFAPGGPGARTRIVAAVREALVLQEPRIDVLDVAADEAPGARNLLLVRVTYRIRENNAVTNLVYPYFLTEGA